MDPITVITGILASFLASAIHLAAERHDANVQFINSKKLEKLKNAILFSRSSDDEVESAISKAFQVISPIKAYNQFYLLFNDLAFRENLLRWMFALEKNERDDAFNRLKSLSINILKSTDLGTQAANVISEAFQKVLLSNNLLAEIIARHDHQQILEAVIESSHKIEGQLLDATDQLQKILLYINALKIQIPTDASEIVEEFGRFTDNQLTNLSVELPIIGSIDRIEQSQALRFVLKENTVLLHGEAGTGKTGIVSRLARELRSRDECVLFIRADQLSRQFSDKCTMNDLSSALGFDKPLTDLIINITNQGCHLWLIIDQIDQVAGQFVGAAFIQLINRLRGLDKCKIIIACRSYEAQSSAFIEDLKLPELVISELPPEIVCRCLEQLNLNPEFQLVRFCGNLLNLFLLSSLVKEGASVSELNAEGQLWNKLRDHLSRKHKENLIDAACDFANEAIHSQGGRFYTRNKKAAERLASWGILVFFSITGQYGFKHERLRDYFIAYDSVIRKQEGLPSLVDRIKDVARTKTIFPWMIQITVNELPDYCARLVKEAFDNTIIHSNFPKRAFLDTLITIQKPTLQLVQAIWHVAVAYPDLAYDLLSPFQKNISWADKYWEAGFFRVAVEEYSNLNKTKAYRELMVYLPTLAKHRPNEVARWIADLKIPPPNIGSIVESILECPVNDLPPIIEKLLDWIKSSEKRDFGRMDLLVKHLANKGYIDLAIKLLTISTEPFIWRTKPESTYKPEEYLSERCHGIFMNMHHLNEYEGVSTILGIPCEPLVGEFQKHILTLKKIVTPNYSQNVGDPYMRWGNLRYLFSPGRTDRSEEWCLWYGLLRIAALGVLKMSPKKGKEIISTLLESSDWLEVRIAMELLGMMKKIPVDIIINALEKGVFREPSALGESIKIFSRLLKIRDSKNISIIAPQICLAIRELDTSRPKFMSLHYSDKEIHWARKVVYSSQTKSESKHTIEIAKFVLHLCGRNHINSNMSFEELIDYCNERIKLEIKPTSIVLELSGERYIDAIPEYESLHETAESLKNFTSLRFNVLFKQGLQLGEDWIFDPIGYVMLLGAQWRIDSPAQSLRAEACKPINLSFESDDSSISKDNQKNVRREKIPVLKVIHLYNKIISNNSRYAPAIRSQFAGLLAMLSYELPIDELKKYLPNFVKSIQKLVLCRDSYCVRSWIRPSLESITPYTTARKAIGALTTCAWRIHFKDHNSEIELRKLLLDDNSKTDNSIDFPSILLSEKDREAIISAYESAGDHQNDILCELGYNFDKLFLLDLVLVKKLLKFLSENALSLTENFIGGFLKYSSRFLIYKVLRPLYERLLQSEDAKISTGCVWDISCAYLVGLEELDDEKSLFFKLLTNFNIKGQVLLLECICDVYHWFGNSDLIWAKIRLLWQKVAKEEPDSAEKLRVFEQCFSVPKTTNNDDEDEVKDNLHIPEGINTLAPLLEKTCFAFASLSTYQRNKNGIIQYLSNQSVGNEEIAVRLLSIYIGLEQGNYADDIVSSDDSITILKNAIIAGGEARRIATQIIERQEISSGKSLAGLLLGSY